MMMDILSESYPHVMDKVLQKMPSYTAITGICDISPPLLDFITSRQYIIFVSLFDIEQGKRRLNNNPLDDVYLPGWSKYWGPDDNNLSTDFSISPTVTNIYVEEFTVDTKDVDDEALTFLKNMKVRFSCFHLKVYVQDEKTAFKYIEMLNPEEISVHIRSDYSSDFLQNPVLKNVKDIFINVPRRPGRNLNATAIKLSLSGNNLRKFGFNCAHFFQDEVMHFVQKFLQGTQILRRLEIFSEIPHKFRNTFRRTFSANIDECNNGFIHLFSATEDAFVLIDKNLFFFRCVKRMNKHYLYPYFKMEPMSIPYNPYAENEFIFPKIDDDYDYYLHDENGGDVEI